jgi:DmsE family decaheme c-type cytochrome
MKGKHIRKLLLTMAAVVGIGCMAGSLRGLPAPSAAQDQAGVTIQDCSVCHEDQANEFRKNPHAILEKNQGAKTGNACESCHGPGKEHIDAGGDKTKLITYKEKDSKKYNEQCLSCHKNSRNVNGYLGSEHAKQGLDCADCHSVHKASMTTQLLKGRSSDICMSCHTEQKAQFSKPFHHPVKEKAMECNDCHEAHSGIDRNQVKLSRGGQEVCLNCHTEKKGPFVFEHEAIRLRGCEGCHETHGSVNSKMLVRSNVASLCLECHSKSMAEERIFGSQPPSFHNLNNARYRNCTTCHVMIHGSNIDRVLTR